MSSTADQSPQKPLSISQGILDSFHRDGAVLLKGLLTDWVDEIRNGIEHNMQNPGPYAAENTTQADSGRFFDDYCNWQRIDAFARVACKSPLPEVAASLMQSNQVQLFHDHVLVKEPGTSKATPWHQDYPYYFVDGEQTVSFWCPVDDVDEATLRLVAGSHRWEKLVLPVKWLNDDNFYSDTGDYLPVPNPDDDKLPIVEWPMQAGDVVAFSYKSLHGARANVATRRRRALSIRYVGDDARYITRPGRTSPPFPNHNMRDGERLREDWFPVVFPHD